MSRLWLHKVALHLGTSTTDFATGLDIPPDTLRIVFEGDKTASPEPNNVSVQVHNLSRESRKKLQGEGLVATVRGAYLDDCSFFGDQYNVGAMPIIFRFDVGNVTPIQTPNGDIITTIEGSEGQVAYNNAYINKAIVPNTTLSLIFQTVLGLVPYAANEGVTFAATQVDANGNAVDRGTSIDPAVMSYIESKLSTAKSNRLSSAQTIYSSFEIHGVTMHGFTREILSNICERHDLIWFNDAGTIYVVGIDDSLDVETLTITPQNGLVGYPKKLESGAIQWGMKIRPEVKPWTIHELSNIQIDDSFNGVYKVGRMHIAGDTHGSNWDMNIEGALL